MTENMIKRVALALWGRACGECVDELPTYVRQFTLDLARAAIASMREPSDSMKRAGHYAGELECYVNSLDAGETEAAFSLDGETVVWQAMIDVAMESDLEAEENEDDDV